MIDMPVGVARTGQRVLGSTQTGERLSFGTPLLSRPSLF
jgi:hypothetical protein